MHKLTRERDRLTHNGDAWRRWGPYLSERAWGTVREDYSADGNAWAYFPHDHARSRVYRWNEDGLAGISDDKGRLCFALTLWNGQDSILKERLFGLTNHQGNHGEDVKEYYYYLDATPTHSWMTMLYKYPQQAFPYSLLEAENQRRSKQEPEYELMDTGIFDEDRYWDVVVQYAKARTDDILIEIRATNRGPQTATLHLLPTLWFRNTWSWGYPSGNKPSIAAIDNEAVRAEHPELGAYTLYAQAADEWLWTDNETNSQRLWGTPNAALYVKDAFHRYVIDNTSDVVNPSGLGTKTAALYRREVASGATTVVRLRLRAIRIPADELFDPWANFEVVLAERKGDADEFYDHFQPSTLTAELKMIQRQALAGMIWSKQFYHYIVEQWLDGDPGQPTPPPERWHGRNSDWRHLYNERVMSMPDKWEYPWYAAWDLAFHCLPLALLDPDFAKSQMDLLTREWYQHPNGQVPAYEWNFSDVNPPVLAWATWRIYKIEQKHYGTSDRAFLERVFHKLMLYFTWWVNRKDEEGNNVFQGGFLGLDNIGVFDRSAELPTGGHIEQSDGTSWMAMFSLNMMTIALELATTNLVYEDIASKFFEHFLYIAAAMNNIGDEGIGLWDDEDEFYYDLLHLSKDDYVLLKVRSFVGLIPLFAVETVEPAKLIEVPGFKERLEWMLANRPDLASLVSRWHEPGIGERRLLSLVRGHRLKRLLARALDPQEFLSPWGIRGLSKAHQAEPYSLHVDGHTYTVAYEPGESRTGLFGGNSNWRGPVWFPLNYLLIESLQKFHHYFGSDFLVEHPTGSGEYHTLSSIADDLSLRMISIFTADPNGKRIVFGDNPKFQRDPHWRDYLLFYEYFHGDNGAGLGASHQSGWTSLVAKLIQQQAERLEREKNH